MAANRLTAVLLVVGLLLVAQIPGRLLVADPHAHSQQAATLHQAASGTTAFATTKNGSRVGFEGDFGSQALSAFTVLDATQPAALLHASVEAHSSAAPPSGATLVSLHCMLNS
ncbi:MAG TPA: hypothetical protein PKG77_14570 [Phycisphaerae bacterium]|nr:hypothetical protein [Phycisphaerae bacterium]HQL75333.1 hypothetical protein [Phycisphaerae bacterium]